MTINSEGAVRSADVRIGSSNPTHQGLGLRASNTRRWAAFGKRLRGLAGFMVVAGAAFFSIGAGTLFAQASGHGMEALKESGQYENLMQALLAIRNIRSRRQGQVFKMQNPENRLEAEFHDGAVTAKHSDGQVDCDCKAMDMGSIWRIRRRRRFMPRERGSNISVGR